MSSVDLQRGLAEQLVKSRTPANWIRCPDALAARVGATTRCEVTFSNTDSVTALLTTTQVDNGKVSWEITQAQLTKEQVAKRVSARNGGKATDCESGMIGRVGNWVPCHVQKDGASVYHTAEITEAKGLTLKVAVVEYMPAKQVQEQVQARVAPVYGREPDFTECSGDLPGIPGSTVQCVTTVDGDADNWAVKVTSVANGLIEFDVARTAQRRAARG